MADPAGPVTMPAAVADAILAHVAAVAPLEGCGLLVGRGRDVVRAVPTPNALASPVRYAIPPDAHFAAIRDARHDGLEVVGAFHSHPASPAVPSPTDRDAAFPDFLFVVAALSPAPHLRAWVFEDGNFAELGLVRTEGAGGPA